jgi:hypothetical protein
LAPLAEEGAPIEQAGQGIGRRQPNQLVLQTKEPVGAAQPGVQLLGRWRFGDEFVGAAVERVDEVLSIRVGRHQNDVDRPIVVTEQSGFPA